MKKYGWVIAVAALAVIAGVIIAAQRNKEPEDEGELSGPELVSMTDGRSTIAVSDQDPAETVAVGLVVLYNSGFIVIHEDADGQPGDDIGVSQLLIGDHANLAVPLQRPSRAGETLHGMLHLDNGDGRYDIAADQPIINDEGKVVSVDFLIKGEPAAQEEPADEPAAAAEAVITYSASGFSPSELAVKAGETVVFRNQSQLPMWTASAMHPTHTVYPGSGIEKCGTAAASGIFDACAAVAAGGEWSFTFSEKGAWAYHNHLQASHFGRINVE